MHKKILTFSLFLMLTALGAYAQKPGTTPATSQKENYEELLKNLKGGGPAFEGGGPRNPQDLSDFNQWEPL